MTVKGEEIVCTPEHPFYSPVKGWTVACELRAGDILVKIAKKIQMNYPDRISDFSNLLNDDNWSIRICCAVCIVEIMNPSPIDKKKAIDTVIQYIEKTDDIVEKHGFEIWLKQHQNH